MNQFESNRIEKIYTMVSIVKLISIFFGGIIIFNVCYIEIGFNLRLDDTNFDTIAIGIFFIFILVFIYNMLIISYKKILSQKSYIKKNHMENIIFFLLYSFLIILSGSYLSPYKFVFLFIIISSTIQFGINYGITMSIMCSAFLLTIDLISLPLNKVNIYFETDLILSGAFLLTSWLLGYYVKIETEYGEKLSELVNKDELTGVYNHRFFQDALTREIDLSKALDSSLSLLFIDIDHFKYYNDLYGHQDGDEVLRKIGSVLKDNIRDDDIVARYGGEEFAVILPKTLEKDAFHIGERIRRSIENVYFKGEENLPNGTLTVSVGVSCFPNKSKNKIELINSADDALYRAKFFNKNRVELYYSILEELKGDIEGEHIDLISSIKTLISVINAKDRYTYGHTERVVIYCDLLANELELSDKDRKTLRYGAYLHDIGKIEISKEILNKKMPLTIEEWETLRQHSQNGAQIIEPVDSLKDVIPLILHHHEKYDGTGYPSGLKGSNIPYLARILSIADSFDAMTSNRPYKSRKSYEDAVEELKKYSLIQFDPELVQVFVNLISEKKI